MQDGARQLAEDEEPWVEETNTEGLGSRLAGGQAGEPDGPRVRHNSDGVVCV